MRFVIVMRVCDWCGARQNSEDTYGWCTVKAPNGEDYDFCSSRCESEAESPNDPGNFFRMAMCEHEPQVDNPKACVHCPSTLPPATPDTARMHGAAQVTFAATKALMAVHARESIKEDREESEDKPFEDGEWFDSFVEAVGQLYQISNPSDRAIGSHSFREDIVDEASVYHVTVFPSLVEIDGEAHLPGEISVQLNYVLDLFSEVDEVTWTFNSRDRGSVGVSGIADGREVWLELLDHAPDGEKPTCRLLPNGVFEELPFQPSSEEIKRATAKKPPHIVKPDEN